MSIEIVPRPADQAAIDHYRRSFNMLGAEIVDLDMNVLAVFDRDGAYSFRANGMAAYIKHASGRMTTCGTESWCEFRLSCAAISPFFQMVFQQTMETSLPGNAVSFTIDLFDKNYSCMSSVGAGK
jgi:hypothetical protein